MMKIKRIFLLLFTPILLGGCTSTPDEGVVKFVTEVKKTSPGYAEKAPDIVHVKPIKFDANGMRDPFEELQIAKPETELKIPSVGGPNPGRPREALEGYPLESILMVGTIEKNGKFFALLKDKTGAVHIAGVGNYVGENAGKIENISDTDVELIEAMPDGKGGWRDHKAKIPFTTAPVNDTTATAGKGRPATDQGATPKAAPQKARAATKAARGTTTKRGTPAVDRGTSSQRQKRGE